MGRQEGKPQKQTVTYDSTQILNIDHTASRWGISGQDLTLGVEGRCGVFDSLRVLPLSLAVDLLVDGAVLRDRSWSGKNNLPRGSGETQKFLSMNHSGRIYLAPWKQALSYRKVSREETLAFLRRETGPLDMRQARAE